MIDYYDHFDEEGNPARIEVDLSLIEDAPNREKPWLLWLFVKTTADENDHFKAFKDDLIGTLEGTLDAVYGGTITKEGWNESYFYAATSMPIESEYSFILSNIADFISAASIKSSALLLVILQTPSSQLVESTPYSVVFFQYELFPATTRLGTFPKGILYIAA